MNPIQPVQLVAMEKIYKNKELALQFLLLAIAAAFLTFNMNRTLVDFDEATYAQVVVDTMHSGQFASFQLRGENWFEKPPLFLWLDMASVRVFGESEVAFRIPAIIAAILCCYFTYLIVRKTTGSVIAAAFGFLVLLFSNRFFVYGRELRLDQAVIAAMLAAFLLWLHSDENPKKLFWIFPLIGVGFLIKSVIAFLIVPAILLYAFFYMRWSWVQSKYLWYGLPVMLLILLPWHLWESVQFGWLFWENYIGYQILQRATSTITGSNNEIDYLFVLWTLIPWIWVLVAELALLIGLKNVRQFKNVIHFWGIISALAYVFFLTVIFTMAKTHLGSYLLPAFPFIAIAIAECLFYLSIVAKQYKVFLYSGFFALVIFAAYICVSQRNMQTMYWTQDEQAVGALYKGHTEQLYAIDWRIAETIEYYGDTNVIKLDPYTNKGKIVKGPFYVVVDTIDKPFFVRSGTPLYPGLNVLYQGTTLALLYSDRDLILPQF